MVGYLREGFCRSDSYTDREADPFADFQYHFFRYIDNFVEGNAVKNHKGFVNRIDLQLGGVFSKDRHHPRGKIAVEGIIG